MIQLNVRYGFDSTHETHTPNGTLMGKELNTKVSLTNKEASKILQTMVDKLDYEEATEFVRKFSPGQF